MGKRKVEQYVDTVIIENKKVSISKLRNEAKIATYRFWALVITLGLIGSMVLPYMSYAAVASTSSAAFTGTVIPGYSMGGVEVSAYGIDINSWGMVESNTVVGSTYGVWSGDRLKSASDSINANDSKTEEADSTESSVMNLTTTDRADGWYSITGKTSYSLSNPDGVTDATTSNRYDTVSPYRTEADAVFWDAQKATSNDSASANIDVSLYADFIIVTKNGDKIQVLDNPDSLNKETVADSNGGDAGTTGTTAVPYYVPLSAIFDAYGIKGSDKSNITIDYLMSLIAEDSGQNLTKACNSSNLLHGTKYSAVNTTGDSEDSFNPYPYSMVFTKETDNGTVVSSIYNNSEAYVYFSPSSVYSAYMTLREEYEDIRSNAKSSIEKNDAVTTFQLGYYLAEMAILEAYLDEALPQDMTRGYVGSSEPISVAKSADYAKTISESPKNIIYSPLMYDVAKTISTDSVAWDQRQLNAIMDTLSVFGYNDAGNGSTAKKYGVMHGATASKTKNRFTALTPYDKNSVEGEKQYDDKGEESGDGDGIAGIYTAPYYPIQQHKMPTSERAYRFQILSVVPYSTVVGLIKSRGLSENVSMSYTSTDVDSSDSIDLDNLQSADTLNNATSKLAALVAQYNEAWEGENAENNKLALSSVDVNQSIAISATAATASSDKEETEETATDTTSALSHFDSALMGYSSSNMDSANVHDLLDIMRSVKGLREETWNRFYNPIKSDGGDTDFFVTRITPANTTYFPSTLINGYMPAGGVKGYTTDSTDKTAIDADLTTINCSFDYFCIPSFAPCFASHTADDCYYGVLNYELRIFYSSKFLNNTLSSSAGVPVADQYETMREAIEEAQEEAAKEEKIGWTDIANLYVMAKRLVYIATARYVWSTSVSASILSAIPGNTRHTKTNDDLSVSGTTLNWSDKASYNWSENTCDDGDSDKGSWSVIKTIATSDGPVSDYTDAQQKISVGFCLEKNQKQPSDITFDAQWGLTSDGYACEANNPDDTYVELGTWSSGDTGKFEQGTNEKSMVLLYNSETSTVAAVEHDLWYSAVYQYYFDKYLEEGGDYYWADADTIKEKIAYEGVTPSVSVGDFKELEAAKHTVYFNAGDSILDKKTVNDSSIISAYEEQMRSCATEITKFVENIVKDIKMYSNAMPTSMQNCLAWADYQNASDSEEQYQTDPSDANVTVNVSASDDSDDEDGSYETPLSEEALKKIGAEWNNGVISLIGTNSDENNNYQDEDTKMVRGVEGSTWTSSTQASCYSISATMGRITALASNSGTTYPYSGLANGRLESGADQYALLQAHTVDYTSIANGISGDLATRNRAQVVDIINPEYSSITDFLDILSNLGALISEIGTGMIRGAADAYSEVSSDSSSSATQVQTSDSATGYPAVAAYQLSDGTLMNRLPASAASFDTSTGELSYSVTKASSTSSLFTVGSGNNTASAALFTANSASNFILEHLSGLYQVIQTLALMIVLVSIVYIAFRNFYAYTMADDARMLSAQTQLKTVLPRTVIAIIMIGLPPVGSGSTGFEGVNYLILRVLDNVMQYIIALFSNLGTDSLINTLTSLAITDFNIGGAIIFLLCCFVIALCFILGVILRFLQMLILAGFYLLGPLAWSFYVWPDKASGSGLEKLAPSATHNMNGSAALRSVGGKVGGGAPTGNANGGQGLAQMIGQKMKLSIFTGREGGSSAAMGHITMFIQVELLSVIWAVLIWAFAMVLVTLSGASNTSAIGTAPGATLSDMSSANASILGALTGGTDNQILNWLLIMLLTVILFLLMLSTFLNFLRGLKSLATETLGAVGGAIRDVTTPVMDAANNVGGTVADVATSVSGFAGQAKNAAGALKGLSNAKGVKEKAKQIGKAMENFDKVKEISDLAKLRKTPDECESAEAKKKVRQARRERLKQLLTDPNATEEEKAQAKAELKAAKKEARELAQRTKGSRLMNFTNMLSAASAACHNKEEGVLASLTGAAAGKAQANLNNQLAQNAAAQKVLDKLQAAGPEGYTKAFNDLSGAEKALAQNALGLTGKENNTEAMAKLVSAQTSLNKNKEELGTNLDTLKKNSNALGVGQATMASFATAQTVNLANKQVRQLENSGAETKYTLSHMLGEDGSFNYDNIGLSARKPSAELLEKKALAESYEQAGMLEEAKAAKAEYAQLCLDEDLDAAGLDAAQKNKYKKAIDAGDYKTAAALAGGAISTETMAAFKQKAQLELATGSDPTTTIHQATGIAKALNEGGNSVSAINALNALEPLTNDENLDKGLKTELAMTRADIYQKAGYSMAQRIKAKEETLNAAIAAGDSATATAYMENIQAMGEQARAEGNLVGTLMACNKSAAAADALVAANALSSEQAATYRNTIADVLQEGNYSMAQQLSALDTAAAAAQAAGQSTAAFHETYKAIMNDSSNGQMACVAAANAAEALAIVSGDQDRIQEATKMRLDTFKNANLSATQFYEALRSSRTELAETGIPAGFIDKELDNLIDKVSVTNPALAAQMIDSNFNDALAINDYNRAITLGAKKEDALVAANAPLATVQEARKALLDTVMKAGEDPQAILQKYDSDALTYATTDLTTAIEMVDDEIAACKEMGNVVAQHAAEETKLQVLELGGAASELIRQQRAVLRQLESSDEYAGVQAKLAITAPAPGTDAVHDRALNEAVTVVERISHGDLRNIDDFWKSLEQLSVEEQNNLVNEVRSKAAAADLDIDNQLKLDEHQEELNKKTAQKIGSVRGLSVEERIQMYEDFTAADAMTGLDEQSKKRVEQLFTTSAIDEILVEKDPGKRSTNLNQFVSASVAAGLRLPAQVENQVVSNIADNALAPDEHALYSIGVDADGKKTIELSDDFVFETAFTNIINKGHTLDENLNKGSFTKQGKKQGQQAVQQRCIDVFGQMDYGDLLDGIESIKFAELPVPAAREQAGILRAMLSSRQKEAATADEKMRTSNFLEMLDDYSRGEAQQKRLQEQKAEERRWQKYLLSPTVQGMLSAMTEDERKAYKKEWQDEERAWGEFLQENKQAADKFRRMDADERRSYRATWRAKREANELKRNVN